MIKIPNNVWYFLVGINILLFIFSFYLGRKDMMLVNLLSGLSCYTCTKLKGLE